MPDSDITPILREPVGSFKKLGSFTLAQKEVDRSKSHSDLANGNLIVSFVLLQNAFRAAMSDFLKVASSSPSSFIQQLMFCFTLSLLSRIKFEPFLIYLLLKSSVFLLPLSSISISLGKRFVNQVVLVSPCLACKISINSYLATAFLFNSQPILARSKAATHCTNQVNKILFFKSFLSLFSIISVLAKSIIRCLPSHSLLKIQSFTGLTVFSIIIVGIKSVIDLFILLCAAKPRISCNADSLYRS